MVKKYLSENPRDTRIGKYSKSERTSHSNTYSNPKKRLPSTNYSDSRRPRTSEESQSNYSSKKNQNNGSTYNLKNKHGAIKDSSSKDKSQGPKTSAYKKFVTKSRAPKALRGKDSTSFEDKSILTETPFSQFNINQELIKSLEESGFIKCTKVQELCIPILLNNTNILCEARTGSGKTLSYMVPIVNNLSTDASHSTDALFITPTRELAVQQFEIFSKLAMPFKHAISASIAVGGRQCDQTAESLINSTAIFATPGRLLHHLDQTSGFYIDTLRYLVLDEGDRLVDISFRQSMQQIVDHLGSATYTVATFSATLSDGVKELQKMFLTTANTEIIRIANEHIEQGIEVVSQSIFPQEVTVDLSKRSTPISLREYFICVPIENKIGILVRFLNTHRRKKVLIFAATCKQVRLLEAILRKFCSAMNILHLLGTQGLILRLKTFDAFHAASTGSCLICTDVAARGVDFPGIHYVMQFDVSHEPETYVHRVGRAARFVSGGCSFAFLTSHECNYLLPQLWKKNIPIRQSQLEYTDIQGKIAALVVSKETLENIAKKAAINYARYFERTYPKVTNNSRNFDLLNYEKLCFSYGLDFVPDPKLDHAVNCSGIKSGGASKLDKLKAKIRQAKEAKKALTNIAEPTVNNGMDIAATEAAAMKALGL